MARVNITTKPGQGAGQQGELFLNTLLDTPVETIGTDILQPSVDTIQGVTADAPQAIEGAPLTIDQQMARVGQDEMMVVLQKELRFSNQFSLMTLSLD